MFYFLRDCTNSGNKKFGVFELLGHFGEKFRVKESRFSEIMWNWSQRLPIFVVKLYGFKTPSALKSLTAH